MSIDEGNAMSGNYDSLWNNTQTTLSYFVAYQSLVTFMPKSITSFVFLFTESIIGI